jgi:hypothetical protein
MQRSAMSAYGGRGHELPYPRADPKQHHAVLVAIRSLETKISTRSSCGVQCFNGNYMGQSTNTEWELSLLSQLECTEQGRSTQEEQTEEVSVGEGDETEKTKATSTLNQVLPILPQIQSFLKRLLGA